MKPDRPSATARRVAIQRAAHQILDQPRVLDDPIAVRILGGPPVEARVREKERKFRHPFAVGLRAFLVARSRCAEDALAKAVEAGVGQYVVLGAGLDTFAYRNPFPTLRVYEVDYPSTQEWKRGLIARGKIAVPDSLTYVPVDFESQTLADRLRESGFQPDRPAFFSWLGVTMYLTREVVLSTLRFVAERPHGSGITFDYFVPPGELPWIARFFWQIVAWRVALHGEPWRTWFKPEDLAGELRRMGFTQLEDLDGPALNQRYFDGRLRALGGRNNARVMTAVR